MNELNVNSIFKEQLKDVYDYVYKITRRFGFDEHTCRDVTQEIMIKLCNKSNSFAGKSLVKTWVYAVAKNYCISFKQRTYDKYPIPMDFSVHPVSAGLSGSVEQRVLISELKKTIALYLNKLPAHLKDPLTCYYYDNLKYTDIARKMDIPVGTVKSRINTAKNKLQGQLKRYVG